LGTLSSRGSGTTGGVEGITIVRGAEGTVLKRRGEGNGGKSVNRSFLPVYWRPRGIVPN